MRIYYFNRTSNCHELCYLHNEYKDDENVYAYNIFCFYLNVSNDALIYFKYDLSLKGNDDA